ncbi:MAG: gliding motility-associated C-terminal domain-containing protein [Filimonas sp.]|nr:gliding motility-associated C-terminal domain-containing protein [Filimonas sp.]
MKLLRASLCIILLFAVQQSLAQCPGNIGFEDGSLAGWDCYAGSVDAGGNITVSPTPPIPGRHTLLRNTGDNAKDYYGGFSVYSPNGSIYSVKLGNEQTDAQAERMSYTFTIPASMGDYSIIYNYAVVLENPSHTAAEQPRFTAKVFNVTDNQYIDCASFEFVASGSLPGFQLSTRKPEVYYKTWSPITIKLTGYAGKTVRLEFTTNDCARRGHFGYAYIDVMQNCTSPITGNTFCDNATGLRLTAPYGFSGYEWYNEDYSQLLGTSNVLTFPTIPAVGTLYNLIITPYPNQGCLDTLKTKVAYSSEPFKFNLLSSVDSCGDKGVNLTAPVITAGSSSNLEFEYFTDQNENNYLSYPQKVSESGMYFVKATNKAGCNEVKQIRINIAPTPNLLIKDPPAACYPAIGDITQSSIIAGSDAGLTYSYWTDLAATSAIPDPASISKTGIYFIKALTAGGCGIVQPVSIVIDKQFDISFTDAIACAQVNLERSARNNNTSGYALTYWTNPEATAALSPVDAVTQSGVYYIKATDLYDCAIVRPVNVTVYPNPDFTLTDPAPIFYPAVMDLTTLPHSSANLNYTYWTNDALTKSVATPTSIDTSGRFYIKATNRFNCSISKSVKIVVKEPVISPPNAFSPNGDGINETWIIPLLNQRYPKCTVDVYNRYGQNVFHSRGYADPWNGTFNGKMLQFATYYYVIKPDADFEAISGNVTIMK